MKKTMVLLCSLLFLISCGQNESKFNLYEQQEIISQDPLAIEYFENITAFAQVIREANLDIEMYQEILKEENSTSCNINKEAFNGNLTMENYAKVSCNVLTLGEKFKDKYPFIKKMSKKEKGELLNPLIKRPNIDLNSMMEKGINE